MQKGNPLKSAPLSASKRALKKKAIAREFEMKRRELGLGGPGMKRGIGFYLVLIVDDGGVVVEEDRVFGG